MAPTRRDIADFLRLAIDNSTPDRTLLRVSSVVAWADDVIASSDVADEWMIDLSMAKTVDAVNDALSQVPPPSTEYLGASIFVAFVHRQWRADALSREDACHLLWNVRDDLPPEHETASIVPEVTLEDAEACISQGLSLSRQYERVDQTLSEFFDYYQQYDSMIPAIL